MQESQLESLVALEPGHLHVLGSHVGVFGSGHGLKEPEKNYDASEPLDWRLGIQSLILGLKMVRLLWYLNFQNSLCHCWVLSFHCSCC